jgi:hypothetical protein
MDRRKFVVGGGAAAVATTLTAVTGAIPAVAASIAGAGPMSVDDHARRVLDRVNVDLGLVDPAGLQRQFERAYAGYLASAPRDPAANDLDAWIRRRMLELCGTDSYAAAVTEVPQTRALLAFSFLAYSQHQDTALPLLTRSMRVPTVLRILEPDFLPVLVDQIGERCSTSREFAVALQSTSAELDRIIAETLRDSSESLRQTAASPSGPSETINYIGGVLALIAFFYWLSDLPNFKD